MLDEKVTSKKNSEIKDTFTDKDKEEINLLEQAIKKTKDATEKIKKNLSE